MLRKLTIITILLIINFSVFYGTFLKQRDGAMPEKISQDTPNFSWQDFDGKTHNIKELSGQVVVLHFWATWCSPCRAEFPALLNAAKSLGKPITFLTISADVDAEKARKFIANTTINPDNVLYGFDPNKDIALGIFQTAVFPETIIIDKNQKMVRKFVGKTNWNKPETLNYLKGL